MADLVKRDTERYQGEYEAHVVAIVAGLVVAQAEARARDREQRVGDDEGDGNADAVLDRHKQELQGDDGGAAPNQEQEQHAAVERETPAFFDRKTSVGDVVGHISSGSLDFVQPGVAAGRRSGGGEQAAAALGNTITSDMAQDRALTEATAFAIRIDVAEEITRLDAHLDEIERLISKGGEVGKRLDFLIQELHREANTLGSKSAALELTRIAVDMKVLIEQMREQVQNIE